MWKNLISTKEEKIILPWTGGRFLHSETRTFKIVEYPDEFGWYEFQIQGTKVKNPILAEPKLEILNHIEVGYLVGNRFIHDNVQLCTNPEELIKFSEKVFLISENLERFSRVKVGRVFSSGNLIFMEEIFGLGPETEVKNAFLDKENSINNIAGVIPSLDSAFRMECFRRDQAEQRRKKLAEEQAKKEAERIQAERKEKLKQEYFRRFGDGKRRRDLAQIDFREAAETALEVGGAKFLDYRKLNTNEWAVKYSVDGQKLECVCDANLQIVDAGVCLTDHNTNEKGDTYFTLESLPSVIRQAVHEDKLVIWRYV